VLNVWRVNIPLKKGAMLKFRPQSPTQMEAYILVLKRVYPAVKGNTVELLAQRRWKPVFFVKRASTTTLKPKLYRVIANFVLRDGMV
jgi:hypothetical protein